MSDRGTVERITEYLSAGGLFNPESMHHVAVRDLLMDCRTELAEAKEIGVYRANEIMKEARQSAPNCTGVSTGGRDE